MKNGFTLVELSIVLVIIGLLIGGVLVGQSLIESASINSQIRQLQQYDIAISNHKNKYRYFPGDNPLFPNNDGGGADGDGLIEGDMTGCGGNFYGWWRHEIKSVWSTLSLSGELSKTYIDNIPYGSNGGIPDQGVPETKLGEGEVGIYVTANNCSTIGEFPVGNSNFYYICNHQLADSLGNVCDGADDGSDDDPVFSAVQALSIDGKMDDGNGVTGDVRAGAGGNMVAAKTGTAGCLVDAGGVYNVNSTDNTPCNLAIELLSSQGR